jgi:biopolymer transport protein ExbB/TolQ
MFVFLSGVPNILNKLGYQQIVHVFGQHEVIMAGLSIALAITTYLTYFSIKSLYRSYKRDMSIENSETKIAELELELNKLNHIYKSIVGLLKEMKRIKLICSIIKNIQNVDLNQIK